MQRQDGFKGGIQTGTTAYDASSKSLDQMVKKVSKELQRELPMFTYMRKLPKEMIAGNLAACEPDGGVWFNKDGKLVAAFEAKKQGPRGNAHERWFMNREIIRNINPDARYVTFCVREGVLQESSMYKGLSFALAVENKDVHSWNILHSTGVSFFGKVNGFGEEFIKEVMWDTITMK